MSTASTELTPRPHNRWLKLGATPLLLVAILYLDSKDLAAHFKYGQCIANLLTLTFFLWMLHSANPRLRRLMLTGVLVATVGEVSFSLVLGMYEYRLYNVPLYVPPGHAILYAAVFQSIREPWVRRHARQVVLCGYALGAVFSIGWLLLYDDVYGCICFSAFSILIFHKRGSRLFFIVMYLLVAYLELLGTFFQCWSWPPYLLHKWPAIASANPPSGIAVFYIGFDIACLGFYKLSIPHLRNRYRRFKSFRKSRDCAGSSVLATVNGTGSDL